LRERIGGAGGGAVAQAVEKGCGKFFWKRPLPFAAEEMKRRGVPPVYPDMKPRIIAADPESKLILQGVHLELTAPMQEIMRDKFMPILRRDPRIIRLDVRLQLDQTLGNERHYTATGRIEIGGPDLVALADGLDAYDVADQLVAKLQQRLLKRHGRRKDRRNHPHETEIEAQLPKVE
jgi:putative sigma-54 modulation protein